MDIITDMEEDSELKALKLKKLMKLMASQGTSKRDAEKQGRELSFNEALEIIRGYLVDRGDEVLDAALEQYPEGARKVVQVLAEKIIQGGFRGEISGEALLSVFEYLGMPVKLKTKILYYKRGEYKSIADLIK